MRRTTRACLLLSISIFGLIIAAPGWSVGDGDARQSLDILVDQLAGKVDVSTDGAATDVAIGDALALPSRIVTGDDGKISLSQGRTGVHIERDSDVEIPEAAAEGQLIARMIQHRGTALYDVETRPLEQLRLTVETPYLVAVVKGTQFTVAVLDGATTISLHEGTLEIRTPDGLQSIELNAGEIAIRSLTDDTIRRLPMDPDRLDEIARADAAAGSPSRTGRTASASDGVAVVGAGNASVPTGGAADGTTVRVATAVRPAEGEFGTIAGNIDVDANPTLGIATDVVVSAPVAVRVDAVNLRVDTGIDASVGLGNGAIDLGAGTGIDTGVDLGGGRIDLGLDTGLDAGVDLGGGNIDLGLDAGLDTGIDPGGTGLDLGVDLGIDADSGLDLDLDLGLGGAGATGGTGTGGGSTGGTGGGGGLLGGLLGPLL